MVPLQDHHRPGLTGTCRNRLEPPVWPLCQGLCPSAHHTEECEENHTLNIQRTEGEMRAKGLDPFISSFTQSWFCLSVFREPAHRSTGLRCRAVGWFIWIFLWRYIWGKFRLWKTVSDATICDLSAGAPPRTGNIKGSNTGPLRCWFWFLVPAFYNKIRHWHVVGITQVHHSWTVSPI